MHTKLQVSIIILKIFEISGTCWFLGVTARLHGLETLIFEFQTLKLFYIFKFLP